MTRKPLIYDVGGVWTRNGWTLRMASPEITLAHLRRDLQDQSPCYFRDHRWAVVGMALSMRTVAMATAVGKDSVLRTRHADTGDLTLETLMVAPLPGRLDKIWVEMDLPGVESPHKRAA